MLGELPKCDPETCSEQVWLDGISKPRQSQGPTDKVHCVTHDLEVVRQHQAKGFLTAAVDSPLTTLWG